MKLRSARDAAPASFRWRAHLLQGLLGVSALALAWRAVNLQLVDHGFLAREGDARFSRVLDIAAHRGTITDRYGEPLAVSTPVDSVWVNPRELALATDQIPRLASALKLDRQELARRVTSNLEREFLYLARHREPAEAAQIKALGIPGVCLRSLARRRGWREARHSGPLRPHRPERGEHPAGTSGARPGAVDRPAHPVPRVP